MKIESSRLTMRVITESDWALFLQLYQDPKVIALCFDLLDEAGIREKFESRLLPWSPQAESWLCLVIEDKMTGEPMGITGFIIEDNIAQVGYLLSPDFHGQQYGTESLKALIAWAESTHDINRYQAVVTEGNVASERVLMKCGFNLDNVIPEAYEIGGKLYADHYYVRNTD
ncbi:GNAT family N-acetyltransferase [Photobacterium sanguinicancri]|uniref:GNAT family N-acetyltransferase n=1 Tax=Photobacterium sanguinicancri TaxID=875932 RepID=UPI0024807F65|nr:GNAT family N-acetyltransferase [Photobacterium sanguinicancri]